MNVLIIAAGHQKRWNNYRGTTKHLIELNGEILLHRTVRQFNENNVTVVGMDGRYKVNETALYIPVLNDENRNADKFLSSVRLWSEAERNVLLLGDVWFSDEAASIIQSDDRPVRFYGRHSISNTTRKQWGEIFAIAFDGYMVKTLFNHLDNLKSDIIEGKVEDLAGWGMWYQFGGKKDKSCLDDPKWCEIDDFTDDFDFPQDLDTWEKQWRIKHGH